MSTPQELFEDMTEPARPGASPAAEQRFPEGLAELTVEIEAKLDEQTRLDEERDPSEPIDHSASNWASEIGHPCQRMLVYARLNWRERKPIDIAGLYKVQEGKRQERELKHKLERAGFEVVEGQARFTWPQFEISGKIDGKLRRPRTKALFPQETKYINPMFFDQIRTVDDLKRSRKWWLRKIPSQLNCYQFMTNIEGGILALTTAGRKPKILPMAIDYDLAEADTRRAEAINAHVAAGTYPAPIPHDASICGLCPFDHLCPQLKVKGADWTELTDDDYWELKLMLHLEEQGKKGDKIKAELIGTEKKPGRFFGRNALMNDIEIVSRKRGQTTFNIPAEIKEPYKKVGEITVTSVEITE